LLGDYGSDSESHDETEEKSAGQCTERSVAVAAPGSKPPSSRASEADGQRVSGNLALPSAMDVLEGEMPDTLSRPKVINEEGGHAMLGEHGQLGLQHANAPCHDAWYDPRHSARDERQPGCARQRGWI
jgi:hypothetical protein